jgi:hypothetical protein
MRAQRQDGPVPSFVGGAINTSTLDDAGQSRKARARGKKRMDSMEQIQVLVQWELDRIRDRIRIVEYHLGQLDCGGVDELEPAQKSDLVAVLLHDLAKSYQMYPMRIDDAIFQNMTSDLTDLLVIRPLDYRGVICNFSQRCFLRPELKVIHFQDYNSHLQSGDFFLEDKGRQLVHLKVHLFIFTYDLRACLVISLYLFCVLSKLSCAWNRRVTSDRSTLSSLTWLPVHSLRLTEALLPLLEVCRQLQSMLYSKR